MLADTFVQILQQQLCATAGTGPGWYGLVGQACVLSNCGCTIINCSLVAGPAIFSHIHLEGVLQIRQSVLIGVERIDTTSLS